MKNLNIVAPDPEKIALLRELVLATALTPDMVQRGVIAYHNYRAMRPALDDCSERGLVEEVLRATLGGISADAIT